MTFDVLLNWEVPGEFVDKFPRTRRQASGAANGGGPGSTSPTGYEVLIATMDDVGTDYAATPTGVGLFNMTFNVRVPPYCIRVHIM